MAKGFLKKDITLFPQAERKAVIELDKCPFCLGKDVVKSGKRKNKYGVSQLYLCKKCNKRFTPLLTKHKTFPLRMILSAITLYNRLYSFQKSAEIVSKKYGINVSGSNVRNWIKDFSEYLPFLRMREFVEKKFERKDIIETTRMFHGQIFDFKYHRAKTELILDEDFKNQKFKPLRDFLDLVSAECPHQIFKENKTRSSEIKDIFNMDQVRIIQKTNKATETAGMVLQAVSNNKLRHEILQEFMIANDSVTIATEIPILLDYDDVHHFKNILGFNVPIELKEEGVITGHIDLIQIRNGMIHIMDYKPSAKKEKPIAQLMIYALALSRLTSLRLFHFKCAWFDKDNYYEFYPLHVVYKKNKSNTRKRKGRK